MPPPMVHPGILHAGIEAERHRRAEREGRILAEIVVGRGVAHFDSAVLHRVGSAASPGTISPAAKTWIWNLLSVASATALANTSAPP